MDNFFNHPTDRNFYLLSNSLKKRGCIFYNLFFLIANTANLSVRATGVTYSRCIGNDTPCWST